MVIRLAEKLKTRIKVTALTTRSIVENPFADWTARTFVVERIQYILFTNTRSLYSTVLYAKGVTDGNQFIVRSLSALREFMEQDGLGMFYHARIAPETGAVAFAKALERSVTGSMNDLVHMATSHLIRRDISLYELAFALNKTPFSALGMDSPRKAFPAMGTPVGH